MLAETVDVENCGGAAAAAGEGGVGGEKIEEIDFGDDDEFYE